MPSILTHEVTRAPCSHETNNNIITRSNYSLSPEARACSLAHIAHSIWPIAHNFTNLRWAASNFLDKEAKVFIRPEVCTGVGRRG